MCVCAYENTCMHHITLHLHLHLYYMHTYVPYMQDRARDTCELAIVFGEGGAG